jgi:hypothetical protein
MSAELYSGLFYVGERHGYRFAPVTRLDHGMSIVPEEEGTTRKYTVWFSKVVTSSSFSATLTWASRGERDAFLEWLRGYLEEIGDPNRASRTMMRVYVAMPDGMEPFHKIAVPVSGMVYDYRAGTAAYSLNLAFVGTSDPVFSSLKTVAPGDPVLRNLYPGGYTTESSEGDLALYDLPSDLELRSQKNGAAPWFSSRRIAGAK